MTARGRGSSWSGSDARPSRRRSRRRCSSGPVPQDRRASSGAAFVGWDLHRGARGGRRLPPLYGARPAGSTVRPQRGDRRNTAAATVVMVVLRASAGGFLPAFEGRAGRLRPTASCSSRPARSGTPGGYAGARDRRVIYRALLFAAPVVLPAVVFALVRCVLGVIRRGRRVVGVLLRAGGKHVSGLLRLVRRTGRGGRGPASFSPSSSYSPSCGRASYSIPCSFWAAPEGTRAR